ncbi:ATP-binding protein [Bacillus sp. Marseille-P3661]|uniref:ATP-binding protein n=1 Tax=Bacillus sp. Marseille-P3661 TaxID=1936234 RepID=UPI000C863299|nr:ATP-binding protein [Bacillus sp. Marseille-P3661]
MNYHLIENISYHILVVLLPLVIYHLFIKEEKQNRSKVFSKFMLISLTMLFLTMSNPLLFSEEYLYDFRVIPIIITFFYGGVRPGIAIIVIMLLYRFSLGGSGFYVTFINYTIAGLILMMMREKFQFLYSIKKRILLLSIFYWAIAITRAVSLLQLQQVEQLFFMLIFSIFTWATLIILIFIVENIDIQIAHYKHIQSAERLNVVSQLAASVAHEVRNPMTAVKGFLQLIKQDNNLNESQNKYIDISLDELLRTETIINDYLLLAKPTTTEGNEDLNVTLEVKSMIDIITSYTNTHNIVVNTSIQDSLFSEGKKSEFKQAILNIMKNSVEAINLNGTLTVKAYKQNNNIYIEIQDNGIGMTPSQVKQLGAPYYSTKDKGTGVGLTIAYRVISDMKGKIIVKSEIGVGTIFKIELPLVTR